MTTSVAVAEFFEREHYNVMRDISNLLSHVSERFSALNFEGITYVDSRGRTSPCYRLTRAGFAMTALGFTGKKAIQFREAYITRFDEMEAKLQEKEIKQLESKYVRQLILPAGDESLVRDSITCGEAVKHLHILGLYPTLTPGQLKGKIKRGELEGHQDERGYWRIYVDQVTTLATGN